MADQHDFTRDPPRTLREIERWAGDLAHAGAKEWIDSYAERGNTVRANREAFERTALRPRLLRDVSIRDAASSLLGLRLKIPLVVAPMGHLTQFHPDGEAELARGVERAGGVLSISAHSRLTAEEIRAAAPACPLIWQIYFFGSRSWVRDQVRIAEGIGCAAICVCADAPGPPVRYLDQEVRYDARKFGRKSTPPFPDPDANFATTWKDIEWLKNLTRLPFIVKGIMTGADAAQSVEIGADAVWISNHGGRQLDSGLATLHVIEECRDAVGKEYPVIVDGGVRTGSDMMKALALGANVTAIGRPALYGLIAGGARGVALTLDLFTAEFDSVMAHMGIRGLHEINRDHVLTPR